MTGKGRACGMVKKSKAKSRVGKSQPKKGQQKKVQQKKVQQKKSRVGASGKSVATKTSIAPMLSVRHGARAVEFYKAAFGAEELYRVEAPDGEVVAQLAVGEAEFWVADESPEHLNFSPETLSGSTTRMVVVVDDPDAFFARAAAAGAVVVSPMEDQYGWHVGRVVDPFGHHWEIGKPLK